MDFVIDDMRSSDGDLVCRVYGEGIATGHATFLNPGTPYSFFKCRSIKTANPWYYLEIRERRTVNLERGGGTDL